MTNSGGKILWRLSAALFAAMVVVAGSAATAGPTEQPQPARSLQAPDQSTVPPTQPPTTQPPATTAAPLTTTTTTAAPTTTTEVPDEVLGQAAENDGEASQQSNDDEPVDESEAAEPVAAQPQFTG